MYTPESWSSAEVITATKLNNLESQWGSADACRVYDSTTQTISTATTTTVTWNSEAFDSNTMHDTSSNTSRITAKVAGVYFIHANIRWVANGTGTRGVHLYKNGSFLAKATAVPDASDQTSVNVTILESLAANDYIEVKVDQNSGGNLDISGGNGFSWFEMHFVRTTP